MVVMASKHVHYRIDRRGFTIIECLLGLAISAMLLSAVAVAFNASVVSFRENEDMFWTMNNARQALTRMTSEIRGAGYVDETTEIWYGVAHNVTPGNQCRFYKPDHEFITYEFRDATYPNPSCRNRLYLIKNATHQEYVLCNNVAAAIFTTTSDNGVDAKSVQISLTVQSGRFQRALAAAAVVRRNL
jgi:prepilin-type N-terminal cleavage/methylation domain-containing protein